MSRFADPSATREVDLGPCECPGTPHSHDWAKVRTDLSGSEVAILLSLSVHGEDDDAGKVEPFIAEWNLLGPDGEDYPPSAAALFALKGPTAKAIGDALAEVVADTIRPPKASAARSRGSRRANGSHTPTMTLTPGT